jgi:hypothetical protein
MEFSLKKNSFLITNKNSSVIINPDSDTEKYSICLYTEKLGDLITNRAINCFDETGEYEVGDTSFQALTIKNNTVYLIETVTHKIAVVSDWNDNLSSNEIELLSAANILIFESNGNNINNIAKLISDIDPTVLILKATDPMIIEIEKELGVNNKQETDKYKMTRKDRDFTAEESSMELVVLR